MKLKKSFSKLLLSLLLLTGVIIPGQIAHAGVLHPLGLKTLHEKISNVKKLPTSFGQSAIQLPASVDLSSFLPSVQNQGSLGSCVAFATTYAKSYEENAKNNWWGVATNNHIFSQSYMYSQIHADNSADGGGCSFSDAFNLLDNQGCATLSDMPYNGNEYAYTTKPTSVQIADAANYKSTSWTQLQNGNYTQIKQLLADGYPVVIGINVYPDFDNLSPSNPIYDNASGKSRGGHGLCVVGYDDQKQAVKIINSWGTGWGINGYGWISYNLIKSQNMEAYYTVD
ncbi:C1 family peptidase [Clostridium akagii]|uniref:C1 family peptidase n=1 Tax=Clostridium akagii TaxID=91623 RepID=UPI00047C0311|nr:C1 family peptidase [Clostridium akagii]